MKFSVLLPTRNGGEQLNDCIASVLSQKWPNLELVISDNCSDPDTVAVIRRFLEDPRVRYLRQGVPISVTENWSRALEACTGDYFVMMGDDDCLLPNYFDKMDELLKEFDFPDCLHYLGYLFLMPGTAKGVQGGRYDPAWAATLPVSGVVPKQFRENLVRSFFEFRGLCQFNSQLVLVSRKFVGTLTRGFYVAPFPDFYSMSVLLLEAERFVFIPERFCVVGISPKSAGHYYYNREPGMEAYLGNTNNENRSPLLNGVIGWLEVLADRYRDRLGKMNVLPRGLARRMLADQWPLFAAGEIGLSMVLVAARGLRKWEYLTHLAPRLGYLYLKRIQWKISGGTPSAAAWELRRTLPFKDGGISAFAQAVAKGEIAR
jgi:glycosyltransferase involved in cell wall biosynthesis